jgi:hypothetical protein
MNTYTELAEHAEAAAVAAATIQGNLGGEAPVDDFNHREAADNAASRVSTLHADIARTQAEIAANLVDARPRT